MNGSMAGFAPMGEDDRSADMDRIIIFSGAGISAESGIATFRDENGLWNGHDVDMVCNLNSWERNYELVHQFYNDRRAQLAEVEPNAAHRAIARWAERHPLINVTQNVDDLFERAGCRDVIHLHGQLTRMECGKGETEWDIGYQRWDATAPCPDCGHGLVKPGVVFFNQIAPRYHDLHEVITSIRPGDVVFVIGTSEQVLPFGHYLAGSAGFTVKVDIDAGDLHHAYDAVISKSAVAAVPDMENIIAQRLGS